MKTLYLLALLFVCGCSSLSGLFGPAHPYDVRPVDEHGQPWAGPTNNLPVAP